MEAGELTQAEAIIASGLDGVLMPVMLQHRALVLAEGIPFQLVSGRRSAGQNAALQAQRDEEYQAWLDGGQVGPEPRPAVSKSKHELGMAYDFSIPGAEDDLDDERWARAGELAEQLGLESGHRYRRPDPGHVEVPDAWDTLARYVQLKTLAAAGAFAVGLLALRK